MYRRCGVTKRLIDLGDDMLHIAQRELARTGISDTVRQALQHATAAAARRRVPAGIRAIEPEPADTPARLAHPQCAHRTAG
jgi:Arc/MetJ family transcription regulator